MGGRIGRGGELDASSSIELSDQRRTLLRTIPQKIICSKLRISCASQELNAWPIAATVDLATLQTVGA